MIAVDWGTSSFRAYQLSQTGEVIAKRTAAVGLIACHGKFEAVLAQQLSGWDDELIVMGGMIGSRNGWYEVPYVACPAGLDAIAAGMLEVTAPNMPGRRIFIAPGLSAISESGLLDVMRGEEIQLLGLLDALPKEGSHTFCLPGTHSKWATVSGGRICAFQTAMTGELYAVLRQHSLLGALMQGEVNDEKAFTFGVETSSNSGGLLNHLFSVRTRGLFNELAATQLPSYLSGLLIGHELRSVITTKNLVHVIGSNTLLSSYQHALAILGIESKAYAEELAAHGLYLLAQEHELSI
jgi:2-dehydro-3-deoxygalactonokinase